MKVNTKNMRDTIKYLVDSNPELANDDKKLMAAIWYLEGWKDPKLYQNLQKVSSPETIRRTRAKLVEDGIIKPSEKTQEKRYKEYEKVRLSI